MSLKLGWVLLMSLVIPITSVSCIAESVKTPPPKRVLQFSGLALVTGLEGTGDGSDFGPLREMVRSKFKNRKALDEDYRDMALVQASTFTNVAVPDASTVADISLDAIGPATSLEGGTMLEAELVSNWDPDRQFVIVAAGRVESVKMANGTVEWCCRHAKIHRLPIAVGRPRRSGEKR